MSFGTRLRGLRKEYKMSQAELSKYTKIGQSTIVEYERDSVNPGSDNLIEIAKVFNVSLDYLLGLTEVKERNMDHPIEELNHFKRPIINGRPATDKQLEQMSKMMEILISMVEGHQEDENKEGV